MKKLIAISGLLLAAVAAAGQTGFDVQDNIKKAGQRLGEKLLTSADAVVARHVEAIGGRDAVLAVRTLMVRGRNTRFGRGDNSLYRYYAQPDFFKQARTPGADSFYVSNGKKTWSVSPAGRRELSEWWAISLKHFRIDGNFIDYQRRGITYDYRGLAGFSTEPFVYYHLVRTFADGFREDLYFDVETGLLHAVWTTSSPVKDSPQVFYDYREVGGVLFPHAWMRVHDRVAPPHLFIVEEIRVNEDFGKDFFAQTAE